MSSRAFFRTPSAAARPTWRCCGSSPARSDAVAGLLLYPFAARAWNNRLAGAAAVAIYQLIPLDFAVLTTGNLTNAFAQAVAVAVLVLLASPAVRVERLAVAAGLMATLLAAFLSHTSTMAILLTAAALIGGLLVGARGRGAARGRGLPCSRRRRSPPASPLCIYYAHFMGHVPNRTRANRTRDRDRGGRRRRPHDGGSAVLDSVLPRGLPGPSGLPLRRARRCPAAASLSAPDARRWRSRLDWRLRRCSW